jgi:hypothetical protein
LSLSIATAWGGKFKKSVIDNAKVIPSKVTGVIVSTTKPKVGERIKVTVIGTPKAGNCQIFLYKGDGKTPWSLYGNSKSFPYSNSDQNWWPKYDKAGTYILKVKGQSTSTCQCSGEAQITIKVQPKFKLKLNPCPPGWKTKTLNSEYYICVPKCPTSFKCPPDWDKECNGCEVKCSKPIEPPK